MTLLLAAAAPAAPLRDAVIERPSAASARISSTAATARYPIGDGSDAAIAVAVTAACQASCAAADPQRIASFVGTLLHGPEVTRLTVQLNTPAQIDFECGYGAQACYYPRDGRVVLSGDDTLAFDGASREFVLAHEYGHHVANHRRSPPPFPLAIDWGTPRWASHEGICRARRRGSVLPGDQGFRYRDNPGEAFAEAFARYHFRDGAPPWKWPASLRPGTAAFEAIREDTLHPWRGRTALRLAGRAPPRRKGVAVRSFRTPLDGLVTLRPSGEARQRYRLGLRSATGRVLRRSRSGFGPRRGVAFTVCGQSRLRVLLQSTSRAATPFRLLVRRP